MSQVLLMGRVISVTEKAIFVDVDGDPECHWFPKSLIGDCNPPIEALDREDEVEFEIPKWLADKKEIEA